MEEVDDGRRLRINHDELSNLVLSEGVYSRELSDDEDDDSTQLSEIPIAVWGLEIANPHSYQNQDAPDLYHMVYRSLPAVPLEHPIYGACNSQSETVLATHKARRNVVGRLRALLKEREAEEYAKKA